MKRLLTVLLVSLAAALAPAAATSTASAEAASADWHSEQPVSPNGLPEQLGEVGDIAFWAPNRGALITAGVGGIPAGVYVYDGVGWHLYSTVCGGHRGSIVWTGPDEFWTVADQPPGQEAAQGAFTPAEKSNRSLCHFQNGAVVASYARPIGTLTSFDRMNAAACEGPSDCWFAGERLLGDTNPGAFHLNWNGSSLNALPSLSETQPGLGDPGRTVADLAFSGGALYESVEVSEEDGEVPGEPDPAQPSFVHLVEPGSPRPFRQLFTEAPLEYGGTRGSELGPFRFAEGGEGLYAVAGAANSQAAVTMVHIQGASMQQIPVAGGGIFKAGDRVRAAAAEPGAGRVWVSYGREADPPGPTLIAAIRPDGGVEEPLELTSLGGARKGPSGPIACPAREQCWMATQLGWLYHLGGPLPRDEDPFLVGPITSRPIDESTPVLPPVELPEDDSGADFAPRSKVPTAEIVEESLPPRRKQKRLISKVKQKLVGGGKVLQLSFRLFAPAHVRLIAKHGKKVVASTAKLTLKPGPHRLRLRLDPHRWPTDLDFKVTPAATKGKA